VRKGTTDGPGRDCTTRHPGAAARRRICLVMTGVARPAAGRPPPSQNSVLCAGTCAPLVMPCLRHLGQICTRSAYQNATHRRVSQQCPANLLARLIVRQMRLFGVTIVRKKVQEYPAKDVGKQGMACASRNGAAAGSLLHSMARS